MGLNDKKAFGKLKKKSFSSDFSSTHGRMCVYGRYAPAMLVIIKLSTIYSKKVHAALTVVV